MKRKGMKILAFLLIFISCINTMNLSVFAEKNNDFEQVQSKKTVSENVTSVLDDNQKENEKKSGWDGVTKESVFRGDGYDVMFALNDVWDDGFNATVRISNTSVERIENWSVAFEYSGIISNIWNGIIEEQEGNKYIVKNAIWNQDIEVGEYVEFGINSQEIFKGFPMEYEILGTSVSIPQEDYSVTYQLNSDWGDGFTGTISVTNNTGEALEDWILEFEFERNISDIWNGKINLHEENHYVIQNEGYNANIAAGQTISFSFMGDGGTNTDQPTNINLYSHTYGNVYDNVDVELNINASEFAFNSDTKWYVVDNEINVLSGTIKGAEAVKKITYELADFQDNIVKFGTICVADNWEIENFGLTVGYNKLTFTINKNNGIEERIVIEFLNNCIDNLRGTNVDLSDTDGDGLCNYYETLLGTDKEQVDTDGDKLSDYAEFLYIGTKPIEKDSDGDGIFDSEEDADSDGLSNISEMNIGTSCLIVDTDEDGLSDGDEVNIYFTNPLVWDTDEDGLSDLQEIELGFNPVLKDSDKDEVIDGEEKVYQTYEQQINENTGVLSVEVGVECNGYLGDRVTIVDTSNIDIRSSEVVGIIGVPVDISVNAEFESADITFTYDEKSLGKTLEKNLAMMWYDEENDEYVVLDSEVDIQNNSVTCTTTHFSTYLIIDKKIWLDNMRMDLNYLNSGDVVYYDMVFVVDVSSSMLGKRLNTAKKALYSFIDAMMDNDRAGLVQFESTATTLLKLTNDKFSLKNKISSLSSGGSTDANAGILEGIRVLEEADETKEKMMILICDGIVPYDKSTIDSAIKKGIKIHCINVLDSNSASMKKIANATGGTYYHVTTISDLTKVMKELAGNTLGISNMKDTDGDGLYDVYEKNGMRLSNGRIVYTDPNKSDTDGDGVSDYDAMGGVPVTETFMLDGNTYSCTLNHSKVYGKLSNEFIYVDGKMNTDGRQYYGKMSYIPYSNNYLDDKYVRTDNYSLLGEMRSFNGAARIHNLFLDKQSHISAEQLTKYKSAIAFINIGISLSTLDSVAVDVFNTYATGKGGNEKGWEEGYTRKTINATKYISNPISNSAYDNYIENMIKTKKAVEGVLNEYNREVYISVSPNTSWSGCAYVDYNDITLNDVSDVLWNVASFGTFNSADAGITACCTYDPVTETYFMEYNYYLIDFYDYSFYDVLQDQDALGFTRSFELYGKMHKNVSWKKGDNSMIEIPVA